MSYPSPTGNCSLFTQCYTVPCSTHSFGNFAFSLAVLIKCAKHTKTSCNFWIAFSVPLRRFTSTSWKAWSSPASFAAELGRSLVCSAEKPSRDFKRSCGFFVWCWKRSLLLVVTNSFREKRRHRTARYDNFLISSSRRKVQKLAQEPRFGLFFPVYFFSFCTLDYSASCKCWFSIMGLVSKFSLCSASFRVPVTLKGRVSWDHCREALAKLSSVSGKTHIHFTGFGSRPLFSPCLKFLKGKPGFFSVCLNLKVLQALPIFVTGDCILI